MSPSPPFDRVLVDIMPANCFIRTYKMSQKVVRATGQTESFDYKIVTPAPYNRFNPRRNPLKNDEID